MNKRWARELLKGIEDTKKVAKQDRRATAAYWNRDSWGSIRDAEEWVENQVLDYILKEAQPK